MVVVAVRVAREVETDWALQAVMRLHHYEGSREVLRGVLCSRDASCICGDFPPHGGET